MRKAMKLSKKPLVAFRKESDDQYMFLFKSAKSGIGAISNNLGPFKLNGGERDLIWKRPDGEQFYVVFTISLDGTCLTQTNTHVNGKMPPGVTTRTLVKGGDGSYNKMEVTQECDGVKISQNWDLIDFTID